MQYNLIKKMKYAKSLEFILRGVEYEQALIEFYEMYATEKSRMFADISRPNDDKFNVTTASGETITYEIEEDRNFSTMALVSKGYDFCLN